MIPVSRANRLRLTLFLLFLVFFGLLAVMNSLTRGQQGFVFLLHGSALLLLSVVVFKRAIVRMTLRPLARLSMLGLIFFWSLSEFGWGINYFIRDRDSRLASVALSTELGYTLAFIFGALALAFSQEWKKTKSWFTARSIAIALIISTPVGLRIFLNPWLQSLDGGGFQAFHFSELVAIVASYVLLNLAILLLIAARTESWSFFACGLISLVFGDWGMRVDKILGAKAQFDIHSVMVMFGIYSAAACIQFGAGEDDPGTMDETSLLSNYRKGALVAIFLPLVVFSASQIGSLESLKVLSVGCAFGAILVVVLSFLHVEKVRGYSRTVATLLQDGPLGHATERIPLELRYSYESIEKAAKESYEMQKAVELGHMAAQVAHDIRSPLAALAMIQSETYAMPEETRTLLRVSVQRINDIANNLLQRGTTIKDTKSGDGHQGRDRPVLVYGAVDAIVSEKRLEYPDSYGAVVEFTYEKQALMAFVRLNASDLKSALSNVINNAIEAYSAAGRVMVSLSATEHTLSIRVEDWGCGIPTEAFARIGERGFTLGKSSGNGLGLYQVKTFAQAAGGAFKIESNPGVGTKVVLQFPRVPSPGYFASSISVKRGGSVLCCDDDESIHEIWQRRFAPHIEAMQLKLIHFRSSDEFTSALTSLSPKEKERSFSLVDYELMNSDSSGLDLITQYGLQEKAICVTSHFEDLELQRRATAASVRLCPKSLAWNIEINVV